MVGLPAMSPDTAPLLTCLLEQVSRSFYKTLWILPRSIRPQISLAYLLARATDTIADTELVPLEQRLDALRCFRRRIAGEHREPLDLGALAAKQGSPGEQALLERAEEASAMLDACSGADRARIRKVLQSITSGQEQDLQRFSGASLKCIGALETDADLDDYTYRVAGCVGEFWTEMCWAHVFQVRDLDRSSLSEAGFMELGVRFGKGLQLVNILRDLPEDLRRGRCYLPADRLRAAGLGPADLLQPENEPRLEPLFHAVVDLARSHLCAGWRYTNLVPLTAPRIRLACAWPILIGARTLALLREGGVLNPARRIKVPRAEVRGILLRSVLLLPVPPLWKRSFAWASRGI